MIAVVQRVLSAGVHVVDTLHSESISQGLCVFVGVEEGDTEIDAKWMSNKLTNLRIFSDDKGKMNLSVQDVQGEILLVSQFTLVADCYHGNRPSFIKAERPERATTLIDIVGQLLREQGVPVKSGVFGATMRVEIENDGPVTIILKQE